MKRRSVAFGVVFCIAILVVSGAYADQPEDKGKPVKPPGGPGGGKDGSKAECIIFTGEDPWDPGDLESAGETSIVGCCPNAGPMPAYTMTVDLTTDAGFELFDEFRDGYVFMNGYGRNAPYEGYKVQFKTWDYETRDPGTIPGVIDYFFEIRGGNIEKTRKPSRVLTVTFDGLDPATVWVYHEVTNDICDPCKEPGCRCSNPDFEPTCNPCSDPDCDPCIDEILIEGVQFVLVRTADLTYTDVDLEISCTGPP
jgi:hypothetical protein